MPSTLLLIKAAPSHLESFPPNVRNQWSKARKEMYASRSLPGDIISVRPGGWVFGLKAVLPALVVVEVLDLAYEDAKQYMDRVLDTADAEGNAKILHKRRFAIPKQAVLDMITAELSFTTVSLSDFNTNRIDKL